MLLGYNTNGLAFHRWEDALELIAETGYQSVAITLDHHCLNPYSPHLADETARMRAALERLNLVSVIETGARFLLNPRVKHDPTLLSPTGEARARRLDFLERSIDIAAALNSKVVSFWSGQLHETLSFDAALDRLAEGCRKLLDHADRKNVGLAFEPEPGMFIETMDQFRQLADRLDAPHFGLTIDIGHVQCVEKGPIAGHIRTWGDRLLNVHIEDMVRGVHEHLRFGEGEIDFPPVMQALRDIAYKGPVNVELSRHSHMAPDVLRESFAFLQPLMTG